MRAYLSRRYGFSASHRLHSDALSDAENWKVYGKCNNPHGHGHNYVLEVTVGGEVDAATGFVCNLPELDECVRKQVVSRFDHTNLNLHECFVNRVPTTENLAIAAFDLIAAEWKQAELVRVRIEETGNNSFEYAGPDDRANGQPSPQGVNR